MLLALARNIPQAHSALMGGAWDRSKYSGTEVYEKTLGVIGFGRIGQLVAQRALVVRDARDRLRPVRRRGAVQGGRRRARRDVRRAVLGGRLHHDPPAGHARDRELAERRRLREDEGRRPRDQRRARQAPGGRRPEGRARFRQGRWRGARRLPRRAGDRASALRLSKCRGHAAPGRIDLRGDRPRRLPGRRAGGRRADRRGGNDRSQPSGRGGRGHGGARPVPAAVPRAGPHRRGAWPRGLGRARGRIPRQYRRPRHAPAHRPGAEGRL